MTQAQTNTHATARASSSTANGSANKRQSTASDKSGFALKFARKESFTRKRNRMNAIVQRLAVAYPDARCALDQTNPLEQLVATILSAQCADERVNLVTPGLFRLYPNASAFASARQEDLEREIHSTGFYHNKARNIIACCQRLVETFHGEVPEEMEHLVSLPGVGRKTANVVRGACWGLPAITVDTHCGRLARRLALTANTDPDKVESDLQKLMPESDWWFFSSAIIWHGRRVCDSRKPACSRCVLADLCPSAQPAPIPDPPVRDDSAASAAI